MKHTAPAILGAIRGAIRGAILGAILGAVGGCVGAPAGNVGANGAIRGGEDGAGPATVFARAAPAPAPAQAVKVDGNPRRLAGLGPAGVTAILGRPDFRRRDGTAELWRYRHESCALDIFLYPPEADAGGQPRVHHFAARSRIDRQLSVGECFGALLRARLTGKSS